MDIPFFRPSELAECRNAVQSVEDAVFRYIRQKRWFAGKGRDVTAVRLLKAEVIAVDELPEWICSVISAAFSDGTEQEYFLPLYICRNNNVPETGRDLESCIAEMIGGPGSFRLIDAFQDDQFCMGILRSLRKACEIPLKDGMLRYSTSRALQGMDDGSEYPVVRPKLEQSHSSYLLGDRMIVKVYRQSASRFPV